MQARQHMTTMFRATAVAACAAAFAAPVASAATGSKGGDVLSRYVANHGTVAQSGDAVSRYVANHFITDTLAPGGSAAPSSPFITDTLAPGGGGPVVVSPGDDGFGWPELGVGFSAAVLLLGLMLAVRVRLQRRKVLAA